VLGIKAEFLYDQGKFEDAEKIVSGVLNDNPDVADLKVRLLSIRAFIAIKNADFALADNTIQKFSLLNPPSLYKSGLHYVKAKWMFQKSAGKTDLIQAEIELNKALDCVEKYGPSGKKPEYLITLARIKKSMGEKYNIYIDRAQNLASGYGVGWPDQTQRRYLKKFELPEQFDVKEIAMEKSTREKKLETLFEVAKSINSILELDPLLNRVMDLMLENLKAERGFIMLKDSDGNL